MSARTTRSTADQPRSRGGHSLSSPFFSALLCPFPALSLPETPEFPRNFTKSSIVGYNTDTVGVGSTKIFSVQYDNLGASTAIPIRSLIQYNSPSAPKGSTSQTGGGADQIWTYKNDAWQKYYYNSKGKVWCAFNTNTEVAESVTVSTGDSFFFQRTEAASSAANITLSGAVKALDLSLPVSVAVGSTKMLCNPWPIDLQVKEFKNLYTNPKGSTSQTGGGADQVWTYKNDSWQKYYYNSKGKVWCAFNTNTEVGSDQVIQPGEGFFFQRTEAASDACTLNFKGPNYVEE